MIKDVAESLCVPLHAVSLAEAHQPSTFAQDAKQLTEQIRQAYKEPGKAITAVHG